MTPSTISQIEVHHLRNLDNVVLDPCAGVNVLFGANGQGKTSILEAIYLAATTKSFRTHRLVEAVTHGMDVGSSRIDVSDAFGRRRQSVGITKGRRVVRINGSPPESTASYAVQTPVVVFHPGELALTMGPSSLRRRLLDRVCLFESPGSYETLLAYEQAASARQRLLRAEQTAGVDAFEVLMARYGSQVTRMRRGAAERLKVSLLSCFEAIAPDDLNLDVNYQPGGDEDEQRITDELARGRERDRFRTSAGVGPHRDELALTLNGAVVRTSASQGQHRLLTLGLKMAELSCLASASGRSPVLLLDDVSSELDTQRTKAFLAHVGDQSGQVFLTTTRPEMVLVFEEEIGEVKAFEVADGNVVERPS